MSVIVVRIFVVGLWLWQSPELRLRSGSFWVLWNFHLFFWCLYISWSIFNTLHSQFSDFKSSL